MGLQTENSGLFARHLCPRCPTGIILRGTAEKLEQQPSVWCCKPRETAQVVHTAARRTKWIVRTRTRTIFRTVAPKRTTARRSKTTTIEMISSLSGMLFKDLNLNGVRESWEPVSGQLGIHLWKVRTSGNAARRAAPLLISGTKSSTEGGFLFSFEPIPVTTELMITRENQLAPLMSFSALSVVRGGTVVAVPDAAPLFSETASTLMDSATASLSDSVSSTMALPRTKTESSEAFLEASTTDSAATTTWSTNSETPTTATTDVDVASSTLARSTHETYTISSDSTRERYTISLDSATPAISNTELESATQTGAKDGSSTTYTEASISASGSTTASLTTASITIASLTDSTMSESETLSATSLERESSTTSATDSQTTGSMIETVVGFVCYLGNRFLNIFVPFFLLDHVAQ